MNIVSSRRVPHLVLSLLVAALAPTACSGGADAPSPLPHHENVSTAKQAITAAPVHEWLFAESGGTTAADSVSVGAVPGTLGTSAALGGGDVTLSASDDFDPNSYVDFGTTATAFGTGDFTVAHWYKTTFGGPDILGDILGNRVDSSHGQFISARLQRGGQVSVELDQDGSGTNYVAATTGVTVNDGAWHHLAFVRQGATVTIYVDGTAAASATADSGQPADVADAGSASFRIGRRLPNCCGNFLTVPSSFQDLRIYDVALGASDIAGIVSQSGPASCSFGTYDCGGLLPVNSCTSTIPCDTGRPCADGSGCASGVCSGGTCQSVATWQCEYNCDDIDTACHDVQGGVLDDCITACGNDGTCLDGCYNAFFAGYDACDAQIPACQAVCDGSCSNGVQDNGETGVDCGGPCAPCP